MYKKWIGMGLLCAILAMGIELYLVGVLWADKETCQVLVLKRDVKKGTLLEEQDYTKVEVAENQVEAGMIKVEAEILKNKLTREGAAGKILTEADFREDASNQKIESVVVKLDYEQSHGGELAENEVINVLCYQQGSVKLVEDLVVRGVEKDRVDLEGGSFYITLSGSSQGLETLVLAKREGSIHILKKTTVHN